MFVEGSGGYNVSLSLLFTAANPGDLVPYQIFRVSSLDGAARTKAAVDSSPPQMIPLPKGVPSYSIVAAITAVPDGGAPVAHMFRIATDEDSGDGTGGKVAPVEWTVPLMTTSQPFGCSNLVRGFTVNVRAGVIVERGWGWIVVDVGFVRILKSTVCLNPPKNIHVLTTTHAHHHNHPCTTIRR